MSCFFLFRLCPPTVRFATTVFFVVVLGSNQVVLADWEPFKSAPVASAKSKTIRGLVSRPEGIGPFPAIIIAHGCFGVEQNQFEWAQRLNAWGYVTVIIDSFTSREVELLHHLLQKKEIPSSREELLEKIWGYENTENIETRTVDIHMAKLRKKLEPDPKNPIFLLTIRGEGYKLLEKESQD